jgi:hypothetical protein
VIDGRGDWRKGGEAEGLIEKEEVRKEKNEWNQRKKKRPGGGDWFFFFFFCTGIDSEPH